MRKRIAIHSAPRSGSTWLGSIFDSHPNVIYKFQPLFSYALKDYLTPGSTIGDIMDFFSKLESTKDDFLDQKEAKRKNIMPHFGKTETTAIVYKEVRYHHLLENMLEKDGELMVIGLIRNPLAVIHSWLKAPKEFKKELGWKVKEEWRFAPSKNLNKPEEFNGYEKWKEVAFLFERLQNQYPDRFYLQDYNTLLTQTTKSVHKMFEFAGLEFTEQTKSFLSDSRRKEDPNAYGVYKTKVIDDQWKMGLPEYIIDEIKMDPEFKQLNEKYAWI